MNKKTLIIAIVVLALVASGLAYYFISRNSSQPVNNNIAPVVQNTNSAPTGTPEVPSVPPQAVKAEVMIKDFSFQPATVTIPKGSAVKWTNENPVGHDIVSDAASPAFRSPILSQGESYSFIFDKAGTFGYHCGIHPSMKGTVIVTE